MRATSPERASCAYRASWQTIACRDVQHCPVKRNSIIASQHAVRQRVQGLVATNISLLREYDEVAPEQPRHAGVHQRVGLSVDEQECGVGHVLPNGWDAFEFLPRLGPSEPTANQLLRQALQERGAATPKANWSQGLGELRQAASGQGFPAGEFLQETRQESRHRLRAGPPARGPRQPGERRALQTPPAKGKTARSGRTRRAVFVETGLPGCWKQILLERCLYSCQNRAHQRAPLLKHNA